MNEYTVYIERSAQKQLDKAPKNMRGRLQSSIDSLARDPRPPGCKKLVGHRDIWRVREGDWRIIYEIQDKRLSIQVVEVVQRKDAYEDN